MVRFFSTTILAMLLLGCDGNPQPYQEVIENSKRTTAEAEKVLLKVKNSQTEIEANLKR